MNFISNITLNIYSIFILIVLMIYSMKQLDKHSLQNRIYIWILLSSFVLLIVDTMGRFDGNPSSIYPLLNHSGNFLLFLISPVVPSLWVMYVYVEIFHEAKSIKHIKVVLFSIFLINTVLLFVSQFNHIFYFIDAENIYHRGPLYLISPLLTFVLIFIAIALLVSNKKRVDKKHYNALLMFAAPPVISTFYTATVYGNSFLVNSVVISILVVGLYIQSHHLNTDYLTGIGNRKLLDSTITEHIRKSSKTRTFSAIMIDLDGFKQVNDTFGHDVGDAILQKTARLLKDSLRTVDFIARYGGDEFCIVVDVCKMEELELIIDRLKSALQTYNETGDHLYKIKMSLGYAIYDYESHLDTEAFEKQLDELMYQNKKDKQSTSGS